MPDSEAFKRPTPELSEEQLYTLSKPYLELVQRLQREALTDLSKTPTPENIARLLKVETSQLPDISDYATNVLPFADLENIQQNAIELLDHNGNTINPNT